MLNKSVFRLYDIRGKVPQELDQKGAMLAGEALGRFFKKGTLVLGFDARLSSPELYAALKSGLSKNKNLTFLEAGLITTPMLYFLVNHFGADGGVTVTASHNPKNFNGFKIVKKRAEPVSGHEILKFLK
jgi:phosphomannomutase